MSENNTRCNYCGRTLYKQVSEKYFVCSQKCKRLIKNNTYIETVDSLVLRVNSTKWSKVDDLNKKVDVNKSGFIDLSESRKIEMTLFTKFGNKIFGFIILLYIFLIFSFKKLRNE